MARPRSSIAALERMIHVVEPGADNLSKYIAEHGQALASRLGVDAARFIALTELPDEQIASRLAQLFNHRTDERDAAHQAEVQAIALTAAEQLGATAVWVNDVAVLDVGLLLGELLVDEHRNYITLDAHECHRSFQVSLPRSLLVDVARAIGQRPDLLAGANKGGLHIRWKQGRGGLDLFPRSVRASEARNALVVHLPQPVTTSTRRPTRGGWFTELLSEVALA